MHTCLQTDLVSHLNLADPSRESKTTQKKWDHSLWATKKSICIPILTRISPNSTTANLLFCLHLKQTSERQKERERKKIESARTCHSFFFLWFSFSCLLCLCGPGNSLSRSLSSFAPLRSEKSGPNVLIRILCTLGIVRNGRLFLCSPFPFFPSPLPVFDLFFSCLRVRGPSNPHFVCSLFCSADLGVLSPTPPDRKSLLSALLLHQQDTKRVKCTPRRMLGQDTL